MSNFKTPRVIKSFNFLYCDFFGKGVNSRGSIQKQWRKIINISYKYVQLKYHDSYGISISKTQAINDSCALISIITLSHHNISTGKSQLGFLLFVLLRSRKSYNLWKGYTHHHYWQHTYNTIYVNIQWYNLSEVPYFILCTRNELIKGIFQKIVTNKIVAEWKGGWNLCL